MSQRTSSKGTFVQKLSIMVSNPELASIIRWDSRGTAISILSISLLEAHALPMYFRHSKYASFVRQLNIYGFTKGKTERGTASSFTHPAFIEGAIRIS